MIFGKTNKLILLQVGTVRLQGKEMKPSFWGIRRSKVKATGGQNRSIGQWYLEDR